MYLKPWVMRLGIGGGRCGSAIWSMKGKEGFESPVKMWMEKSAVSRVMKAQKKGYSRN